MTIGTYIKNLRIQKNLSQRELSELSNLSNAEISRIESGERQEVSPISLKAIAPHLGVHYLELYCKAGYIEEELYESLKKLSRILNYI